MVKKRFKIWRCIGSKLFDRIYSSLDNREQVAVVKFQFSYGISIWKEGVIADPKVVAEYFHGGGIESERTARHLARRDARDRLMAGVC